MSYRRLDENGTPLPRSGRITRRPAQRQERGQPLYHYEIVVAIAAEGGKWKYLKRRYWLPDDTAAQIKERELKHEPPLYALTWPEAHRLWLEGNSKRFSRSHVEASERTMREWAQSFGANSTIEGTSLAAFTSWVDDKAKGNTGRTAQVKYGHLLAIARWCRQRGLIKEIPFEHAPKPIARMRKRGPISPEQFHRIAAVLPENMRLVWQLMGLTGMRLSAACSLKEKDITDREFTVTTKGSKRVTYSITPTIADIIMSARKWKEKRKKQPTTDALFCNRLGTSWNKTSFGHGLQRCLGRHKLPVATSHQLRHLAGTLMAESNFSPDIIQAGLGHDSRASAESYVDQTQSMRDNALKALDKILTKNDTKTGESDPIPPQKTQPQKPRRHRVKCPQCGHIHCITR